jgi:CHASE3 domain sensor protein
MVSSREATTSAQVPARVKVFHDQIRRRTAAAAATVIIIVVVIVLSIPLVVVVSIG